MTENRTPELKRRDVLQRGVATGPSLQAEQHSQGQSLENPLKAIVR
jgi:hypothetical protein